MAVSDIGSRFPQTVLVGEIITHGAQGENVKQSRVAGGVLRSAVKTLSQTAHIRFRQTTTRYWVAAHALFTAANSQARRLTTTMLTSKAQLVMLVQKGGTNLAQRRIDYEFKRQVSPEKERE